MALRSVHQSLHFGISESEAKSLILQALQSAGLDHLDALVLFGGGRPINCEIQAKKTRKCRSSSWKWKRQTARRGGLRSLRHYGIIAWILL